MNKVKEYTTLEMLEEVYKNQDKVFETENTKGTVGFYESKLCWFDSETLEYSSDFSLTLDGEWRACKENEDGNCQFKLVDVFKFIWTEVVQTVNFEDWEKGVWYKSSEKASVAFKIENGVVYQTSLWFIRDVDRSNISYNDLASQDWIKV